MEKKLEDVIKRGKPNGDPIHCIIIGTWTCSSCGKADNYGIDKSCPGCGSSKDEKEAADEVSGNGLWYTEEDFKNFVTVYQPNWQCQYCGTMIDAMHQNCTQCAGLQVSKETPSDHRRATPTPVIAAEHSVKKTGWLSTLLMVGVAALILIAFIILLWYVVTGGKYVSAQVSAFKWSREIQTEKLQPLDPQEGWEVPKGAEIIKSWEAEKSREKVITGYKPISQTVDAVKGDENTFECGEREKLKNGLWKAKFCKKIIHKEPIYGKDKITYATKYLYRAWEYRFYNSVKESRSDHAPFDPNITLGANERVSANFSSYHATFLADNKQEYILLVSESEWNQLRHGDVRTLYINVLGIASLISK